MPGRSRPRFAILARDCADMPQWHASCLEGSLTSPVLHRAKVNDASIARLPKPQEKAEADGNRTRPPGINRRTGFEDREGHQSPFASWQRRIVRRGPRARLVTML